MLKRAVMIFLKDKDFPRFSMKKGEEWGFVVAGKLVGRYEKIKNGKPDDEFEFAGGFCRVSDVGMIS